MKNQIQVLQGFAARMREAGVSIDELADAFKRANVSMRHLTMALEFRIANDLARLNPTQRAIYFAHRRGGLDHYETLALL